MPKRNRVDLALFESGGLDTKKLPARVGVARGKSRDMSVRDDAPHRSLASYECDLYRWIIFVDPNSECSGSGATRKPSVHHILACPLQDCMSPQIGEHQVGNKGRWRSPSLSLARRAFSINSAGRGVVIFLRGARTDHGQNSVTLRAFQASYRRAYWSAETCSHAVRQRCVVSTNRTTAPPCAGFFGVPTMVDCLESVRASLHREMGALTWSGRSSTVAPRGVGGSTAGGNPDEWSGGAAGSATMSTGRRDTVMNR
jgi:hypothetical protein